jgi:hypothetical protein
MPGTDLQEWEPWRVPATGPIGNSPETGVAKVIREVQSEVSHVEARGWPPLLLRGLYPLWRSL